MSEYRKGIMIGAIIGVIGAVIVAIVTSEFFVLLPGLWIGLDIGGNFLRAIKGMFTPLRENGIFNGEAWGHF